MSGWIAGRSSGAYGIVLNAVTERVFERPPVPAYLPPGLVGDAGHPRSLLVAYLTGGAGVLSGMRA